MSRARSCRLALLVALGLAGCFSEAGIDPVEQDPTGGPACIDGAVGCACYGNGSCDPGLQCEAELQRCIPEGCTPGAAACVCAAGECDAPNECKDGLCAAPGTQDDGDDDGGTSGQPSGSDEGPVATSTVVDDTGSDDASTGVAGTSTGVEPGTSDSGGPVCDDEAACEPCFECADASAGACGGAQEACMGVTGCMTAVACLTECGLYGTCFEPCCEGLGPAQVDAINALLLCRTDHCTSSCARLEIPTC